MINISEIHEFNDLLEILENIRGKSTVRLWMNSELRYTRNDEDALIRRLIFLKFLYGVRRPVEVI